jgi:hypothetical protein
LNAALLARLIEAGTPAVLVAEVASELARYQAQADALEKRRANERDRKAKSREVTGHDVTTLDGADKSPPKEIPPTPPKEITPPSEPNGSGSFSASEFDEFWSIWPNKVGRKPAMRAFRSARKREDLETILDGVRRYVRTKPEGRDWLNPATFLNQERWNDEPSHSQPASSPAKRTQLDRVFGALAEIGAGLDDPRGRPVDSAPGSYADAADGGSEFGGFVEVAPRLRAI